MVWTPLWRIYKGCAPSISIYPMGGGRELDRLAITYLDDVGFLEQLYFPIGSSFSSTTLHNDVTYNSFWKQNCCWNSSSILTGKNVGMTPHPMFALTRDRSDSNRSSSWYILQLNWVFHRCFKAFKRAAEEFWYSCYFAMKRTDPHTVTSHKSI